MILTISTCNEEIMKKFPGIIIWLLLCLCIGTFILFIVVFLRTRVVESGASTSGSLSNGKEMPGRGDNTILIPERFKPIDTTAKNDSPAITRPPRTGFLSSAPQSAISEATPTFAPVRAESKLLSWTENSCALGSRSPTNCVARAYRFCSAKRIDS